MRGRGSEGFQVMQNVLCQPLFGGSRMTSAYAGFHTQVCTFGCVFGVVCMCACFKYIYRMHHCYSSSALMNHSEEFDQDSSLGKAPVVS